jgi:hypothetical protein
MTSSPDECSVGSAFSFEGGVVEPPEGLTLKQWQAENCALYGAKIQLRHGPDDEPENLTSYLYRKIYWDLRGTDPFDLNKAGPRRDGLRERAHSITESVLRDLIRAYATNTSEESCDE